MMENEFEKDKLTEKELAILDREYSKLKKDLNVAYTILICLGFFGTHKFYLGKIGLGILYLFTFGLFFFGLLYDFVTLRQQVIDYNDILEKDLIHRLVRMKKQGE